MRKAYPDIRIYIWSGYTLKELLSNNSNSQRIRDILKKCDSKSLPLNYEFFVEFLMKKPTLQHKYKKMGAILLAYSPCTYEVKFGRLFTKPKGFYTDSRETYAKKLGFDYPRTIFEGNFANFERGIKSQELNDIFRTYADYEQILKDNKLENGQAEESMKFIREKYQERLRNGELEC